MRIARSLRTALLVCAMSAPVWAQNKLTNPSFEDGVNGWTQFGGGSIVTQGVDNLFGMQPTDGQKIWDMVTSWGSSGSLDGVYQTLNLQPGQYTLLADAQAHNNDAFAYVPSAPAQHPGDTFVQLGVDLAGGTDPAAAAVTKTPAVTTGARFQQLSLSFTVTTAGPVSVFLIAKSSVVHAGNWEAFDNASLTNDADCLDSTSINTVSPSLFIVPPKPSVETLTITGAHLDVATSFKLVGPTTLDGTIQQPVTSGQALVTFDFTNAGFGSYDLVATRVAPCKNVTKTAAVTFECSSPTVFTSITPRVVVNPINPIEFTVSGTNLDKLSTVTLRSATGDVILTPATTFLKGDKLIAIFLLACTPGGPFDLCGARTLDGCADPTPLKAAVQIQKPPKTSNCAWHPWAADWSKLNYTDNPDLPPNTVVPANWDYTFSQNTLLTPVLTKDTPTGGGTGALHMFFASQASQPNPPTQSESFGSGGVYQEIPVTPGVPLKYSFYWKGVGGNELNWFEFHLIDGPFSIYSADKIQESSTANNPNIIRKRSFKNSAFGWTKATDQSFADFGPAGPRAKTITPTGNVVTVVLKCGHNPTAPADGPGGVEVMFDSLSVSQGSGPNLVVNGDFENAAQAPLCNGGWLLKDACEGNYWLTPHEVCDNGIDDNGDGLADCADSACTGFGRCRCHRPFADADGDGDVDQIDFSVFQLCFTGETNSISADPAYCLCFDRDLTGTIGESDFLEFLRCVTGPDVPWSEAGNPPGCNP